MEDINYIQDLMQLDLIIVNMTLIPGDLIGFSQLALIEK